MLLLFDLTFPSIKKRLIGYFRSSIILLIEFFRLFDICLLANSLLGFQQKHGHAFVNDKLNIFWHSY